MLEQCGISNWLCYERYKKALRFFGQRFFFFWGGGRGGGVVKHEATVTNSFSFVSSILNNTDNSNFYQHIKEQLLQQHLNTLLVRSFKRCLRTHTHTRTSLWFIQHIQIKSFTLFSVLSFTVLHSFISVISENIRYSAHQRWICTKGQKHGASLNAFLNPHGLKCSKAKSQSEKFLFKFYSINL